MKTNRPLSVLVGLSLLAGGLYPVPVAVMAAESDASAIAVAPAETSASVNNVTENSEVQPVAETAPVAEAAPVEIAPAAVAALATEPAPAASDRAAAEKVTFKFTFGKKDPVTVEIPAGEKIGDKMPVQDPLVVSHTDPNNKTGYTLHLTHTGYRINGEKKTLDEVRAMEVKPGMTFEADYTINSEYTMALYDGRDASLHKENAGLHAPVLVSSKDGSKVTGSEWKLISSEELSFENGDEGTALKQIWKATSEAPLYDAAGNQLKYSLNQNDFFKGTAYMSSSNSGGAFGGEWEAITNNYGWVYVWVSDATDAHPVTVKIKGEQTYGSVWGEAHKTYVRNYQVTAKGEDHDAYPSLGTSTGEPEATAGRNEYWSTGTAYTVNLGKGNIGDRKPYAKRVITLTAEPLDGYTLVKTGSTVRKADGTFAPPAFWYFKNLTVTFDANGGSFTTDEGEKTSLDVPALQTNKISENNLPPAPHSEGKTFLGWVTKDDPNTIVDLTNTPISDNTTYIAKWDEAPKVTVGDIVITEGDELNPLDWITIEDPEDGAITPTPEMVTENNVDPKTPGTYTITYVVTDAKGNKVTKTVTVTVAPKPASATTTTTRVIKKVVKKKLPNAGDVSVSAGLAAQAGVLITAAGAYLARKRR